MGSGAAVAARDPVGHGRLLTAQLRRIGRRGTLNGLGALPSPAGRPDWKPRHRPRHGARRGTIGQPTQGLVLKTVTHIRATGQKDHAHHVHEAQHRERVVAHAAQPSNTSCTNCDMAARHPEGVPTTTPSGAFHFFSHHGGLQACRCTFTRCHGSPFFAAALTEGTPSTSIARRAGAALIMTWQKKWRDRASHSPPRTVCRVHQRTDPWENARAGSVAPRCAAQGETR